MSGCGISVSLFLTCLVLFSATGNLKKKEINLLVTYYLSDFYIRTLDVSSTYSDIPSLTLAFLINPKFPRPNCSNKVIDSRGKIISFPIQVGISQLMHSILSNFEPTKLNQNYFFG